MKSMQLISYTSYVVTYIMLHQHLYSLSFKTTVSEKKNKGAVLKIVVYDFSLVFGDLFCTNM